MDNSRVMLRDGTPLQTCRPSSPPPAGLQKSSSSHKGGVAE